MAAVLTLAGALTLPFAVDSGARAGGPVPVMRAPPVSAQVVLEHLVVKGRAPMTGYDRSAFGPAWADVDRNGCDTRNDILRRDLRSLTVKPGTRDCVVLSGVLTDPYTARTLTFTKSRATSVQIDHVVALGDAWQTGAQQLSPDMRRLLANDPLNLLAVDGPTNQRKSDADAATWLPPNKTYRCAYVARQVAVKAHYRLWVTPAERAAVRRVLSTCPHQPLPSGGLGQRVPPDTPTPATTAPTAPGPPSKPADVNCSHFATWLEANAWFHTYFSSYGDVAHLDGNSDGVPCQSLPGAP